MIARNTKVCVRCHRELPIDDFYKDQGESDGRRYECKGCTRLAEGKRHEASKVQTKICNACGEDKPLDDFERQTGCKDGRRGTCKLCRKLHVKTPLKKTGDQPCICCGESYTVKWFRQINATTVSRVCKTCERAEVEAAPDEATHHDERERLGDHDILLQRHAARIARELAAMARYGVDDIELLPADVQAELADAAIAARREGTR
jgi:hypothetical protein